MKNKHFLIIFLSALGILTATQIRPVYAQGMTVQDIGAQLQLKAINTQNSLWQNIQNAFNDWLKIQQAINQEIASAQFQLNQYIANHMSQEHKEQMAADFMHRLTNSYYNDHQLQQSASEEAVHEAAKANQEALIAAINRNKPNPDDCIRITAQLATIYNARMSVGAFNTLMAADAKNVIKPANSSTSIAKTRAAAVRTAVNNPTSSNVQNNPDERVVRTTCATASAGDQCYNTWVSTQVQNTLNGSQGVTPPISTSVTPNPAIDGYTNKWADWLSDRSTAANDIPALSANLKNRYVANYTTAFNLLNPIIGSDATSYITGSYPNSDKVGLTNSELHQIQLNAINMGAKLDPTALEALKLNLEADTQNQTKYDKDIALLRQTAPTSSPGSIAVGGAATTGQ